MRTCRIRDYHPFIDAYMDGCRDGSIVVEDDILKSCDYIELKLSNPDVFIDAVKINKAVELMERYFEIKIYDWELLVVALIHCFYCSTDTVVFDEIVLVMGRGNGKNGFISALAWYLTTHYHGIRAYNIDIVANSEEQAKTSFEDIYDVLERTIAKSKKFFYWTKELIKNIRTNSYIKFNTSNSRTKDGKRTGCLIVDEFHEYENYNTINVFKSGFGKKKHSRIFKISTNGHIREGVYDEEIRLCEDILNGIVTDTGILPLLYRVKKKEDVKNPARWHVANPSLKYKPELKKEMDKEFVEMKYKPSIESEFWTKRMNYPKSDREIAVTDWDNIAATNKEFPDLKGWTCSVGIDYTLLTDWASVNLHFKKGKQRFDINRAWMCSNSSDIPRLKIPWRDWCDKEKLYLVDDVQIQPEIISDYISEMMKLYDINGLYMDQFRYSVLSAELSKLGFENNSKDPKKRIHFVSGTDIIKVVPLIDSCFANQDFCWGDDCALRWATNNTKKVRVKRKLSATTDADIGNYSYAKMEPKSRKTDPFMALVASMVGECETAARPKAPSIGTLIY